ncbi:hypothetical protein Tco_0523908, partial [Tanacetum coccineum]
LSNSLQVEETFGLDMCGDVQVACDGLTARGRNSKSPSLVIMWFMLLVLAFLAVIQGMHMTRWWDTNQDARKHPEPSWLNDILDDEVSYDGGCCSKKKTWSIA